MRDLIETLKLPKQQIFSQRAWGACRPRRNRSKHAQYAIRAISAPCSRALSRGVGFGWRPRSFHEGKWQPCDRCKGDVVLLITGLRSLEPVRTAQCTVSRSPGVTPSPANPIVLVFEPQAPPGASLCERPLNVPQIVREIPDQLTGAIHLAADAAIACTNHSALRRRISPETVMTHKFDAIPGLECVKSH